MTAYDTHRLKLDPTYAPGRVFDHGNPYWRVPKADKKAGYAITSYRLNGTEEEQAAKCRELTRELLKWRRGKPKVLPETWGWIIARYKTDDLSPIRDVKANSRKSYIEILDGWLASRTFAEMQVQDTTFEVMKRWKMAMESNGRSTSFIQRRFVHLRMVANYGLAVKPALFRDVCSILGSGALKIRSPKPRTVAPSSSQILSIIAEADKAGDAMFALGLSLQWWLTLRAVDVRGQWLDHEGGRRWGDGLTWDMIDLEAQEIRKMVSKTERHDSRPMVWDLAPLPDLVARIAAIPVDERVGAVIKSNGKPFEVRHYRDLWARYREAAGVPKEVQLMDTRAGAINDALRLGADRLAMQHAANHKDGATTERYIRDRDMGANNVILLRSAAR